MEDWIGLKELKDSNLYRSVIAEFLGSMFLVLFGCGVATISGDLLTIAFGFGLILTSLIWVIGNTSGGHMNPAVTVAMLVTRHVSLLRAVIYLGCQIVGSITGAGILYGLLPATARGSLGQTSVSTKLGLSVGQGFGVEFLITFVFVFVIFAVCDDARSDVGTGTAPLAIGLALAVGHLLGVKMTGAAMNPSRSLGPAVVMGDLTNQWVYWVGPILGGSAAALLYSFVLRTTNNKTATITEDMNL